MVFFIGEKKRKPTKKHMHQNFSNQSKSDRALDSPADVGAVLGRQLTESSRDTLAHGRKTRRPRGDAQRGEVWRTQETRGAGNCPHSPPVICSLGPFVSSGSETKLRPSSFTPDRATATPDGDVAWGYATTHAYLKQLL